MPKVIAFLSPSLMPTPANQGSACLSFGDPGGPRRLRTAENPRLLGPFQVSVELTSISMIGKEPFIAAGVTAVTDLPIFAWHILWRERGKRPQI